MEFRRMNNGSVRCLISEEDMQEHGLEVTDFLNDRDKVHEFLGIVIEKAKEEVGYVNETGILSMQVMPLSKGRLSIIFSEKEDFTMLNEMKNMFDGGVSYEDLQNMLDDMNDEDDDEYEDDDDDFEDTDEDIFVDEDKQEAAAEKEALQPSEDGEADDKLDIEEVE